MNNQESQRRAPPPTKTPLDPSISGLKKTVKQVMSLEAKENERPPDGGILRHKVLGKVEFAVYKTLLLCLYIIYATFRYCQRQYNRVAIKLLDLAYNPSNSPQLIRQDVIKLQKIPKRLAAVLEAKPEGDIGGGINGLINDASDVVCWTISAGIKGLALYDYDGLLKQNVTDLRAGIHHKLSKYFGPDNIPKFAIRVPHSNELFLNLNDRIPKGSPSTKVAIEISLLSKIDGRNTIVDLTKTMADLCTKGQLNIDDVNVNLVNQELVQLVGQEPDLLLYFGPTLDLQGFPPWHIRLTEFYWETDNDQVSYYVFIRGLQQYADCKMNVGK